MALWHTESEPLRWKSAVAMSRSSARRNTTAERWVVHPEFSAFAEREGLTMEACIRCHHSRHVFALQVVAALRFDWIVQLHWLLLRVLTSGSYLPYCGTEYPLWYRTVHRAALPMPSRFRQDTMQRNANQRHSQMRSRSHFRA